MTRLHLLAMTSWIAFACAEPDTRDPSGGHTGTGNEPMDSYDAEANQTLAKNLKGKLFLMHGLMDDNVPPQNTLVVVDALIKANKDFDLLLLPNQRHGYGIDAPYVMRRRWDYFVKNLLGVEPPKEYKLPGVTPPRPAGGN